MQRFPARFALLFGLLVSVGGCSFLNSQPVDTSDPAVTARVRNAIKQHPELEIQYFDLDTHEGVVTISGIVTTEESRYNIVQITRRLRGVRQVVANLVVRQ
ncbi:MAG: BON domain-containing protein [Elusimicrobia bacterium]|nr:BON domain-containing protein [Elusimicrobiota bacterium]